MHFEHVLSSARLRDGDPEQVSRLTGDTMAVIQEHYSTPANAEMQAMVQDYRLREKGLPSA